MQPYNPEDLDIDSETMKIFLGQTAARLGEIDKNIVGTSTNLNPKRHEFEATARNIMMNETRHLNQPPRVMPQGHNMPPHGHTVPNIPVVPAVPYIDQGRTIPKIDGDPNQMEFCFDNSVTAITIFNKITEMEKKLLTLDRKIQTLIDSLDELEDTE